MLYRQPRKRFEAMGYGLDRSMKPLIRRRLSLGGSDIIGGGNTFRLLTLSMLLNYWFQYAEGRTGILYWFKRRL